MPNSIVVALSDAQQFWILFAAAIVLALALAALTVVMGRRRRTAWQRFAWRHRLRYRDDPAPQVEGLVDRRKVRLYQVAEGSDTGLAGVEEVVMAVELHGALPAAFEVIPAPPVVGETHRLADEHVVVTGVEDFDEAAVVRAQSETEARAYLTPERRAMLLEWFDRREGEPGLADGAVYLRDRTMVTDLDRCEDQLRSLLDVARRLDKLPTT